MHRARAKRSTRPGRHLGPATRRTEPPQERRSQHYCRVEACERQQQASGAGSVLDGLARCSGAWRPGSRALMSRCKMPWL
eukprot:6195853-Pleurochrysis_carterae.AAC.1